MTTRLLDQPLWFSRLSDEDRARSREMRRAPGDPFDWSRRQVAAHHRTVYRVALAALGPGGEAEAEEVAQEAFLRLHAARHRFRGDSKVSTWLHRVALRLAIDRRRRPHRKHPHLGEDHLERLPTESPREDPFERTARSETAGAVDRALGHLTDAQRTVVRLHYWLGASVAEIADHLGMPPGTVKSHLSRARASLAETLGGRPR